MIDSYILLTKHSHFRYDVAYCSFLGDWKLMPSDLASIVICWLPNAKKMQLIKMVAAVHIVQ